MPSFFDPGHGFLSSIDEVVVAALAVLPFVLIGAVAEYVGDAKGWTVLGALVGYVVALFVLAPPSSPGSGTTRSSPRSRSSCSSTCTAVGAIGRDPARRSETRY
ncbi:hypothetical protein ACFQE8_17940 [Salinirubellus sp. GCM10025818]|uniref:hypothetical protein n=1 Tax=Salinirubellus TaxID=2162630 RepID=UPI0030CB45F2